MTLALEPFSLLILLVFLMGLLLALGLWFLVTLPAPPPEEPTRDPAPPQRVAPPPAPPQTLERRAVAPGSLVPHAVKPLSNDDLRGARVKAVRPDAAPTMPAQTPPKNDAKRASDNDLFERFLRNKNDDLDF